MAQVLPGSTSTFQTRSKWVSGNSIEVKIVRGTYGWGCCHFCSCWLVSIRWEIWLFVYGFVFFWGLLLNLKSKNGGSPELNIPKPLCKPRNRHPISTSFPTKFRVAPQGLTSPWHDVQPYQPRQPTTRTQLEVLIGWKFKTSHGADWDVSRVPSLIRDASVRSTSRHGDPGLEVKAKIALPCDHIYWPNSYQEREVGLIVWTISRDMIRLNHAKKRQPRPKIV